MLWASTRHVSRIFALDTRVLLRRRQISTCSNYTARINAGSLAQVSQRLKTQSRFKRYFSSFNDSRTTIYALSTAPGRAAIAIVRCSGPSCQAIYRALCPDRKLPKPRQATLRTLYSPNTPSEILDSGALVLLFPGPNTVTGEDVLEFHIHGGPATVKAVLNGIGAISSFRVSTRSYTGSSTLKPGQIRYAEPGEFTRRAFANARLSLPQIEALGATLAAETESQRRLATSASGSGLSERYEAWRKALIAARGELEALIDFSEDQHIDDSPVEWVARVADQVADLRARIVRNAENAARGELLRGGIGVALLGPPNAGKSSLLNAVVGRDAAIVSSEAGTTRDVLDVSVDVGGFACRFLDLAGLRGSAAGSDGTLGEVETEGIKRARDRAARAQVVIVILPVVLQRGHGGKADWRLDCNNEILDAVAGLDLRRQTVLLAVNKVDLLSQTASSDPYNLRWSEALVAAALPIALRHLPVALISCRPDATPGIQPILRALTDTCKTLTSPIPIEDNDAGQVAEDVLSLGASERQRLLLLECAEHLDAFSLKTTPSLAGGASSSSNLEDVDVVLAAEDLRSAADCLSRVTGRGEAGDVEEVLGVVFEKFCVGK